MSELEQFWQACLAEFRQELSPQQFNTWIKPLRIEPADEGLLIASPSKFVQQWVKEKYAGIIESKAHAFFGGGLSVGFVISVTDKETSATPSSLASSVQRPVVSEAQGTPVAPQIQKHTRRTSDTSYIDPQFSFANYVGGKANELARAAALQVSENPGISYNPLFIYGGSGLGKTHLIQAIGNQVREHNPAARISFLHAQRYVSDVVKAFRHRSFDAFKQHYETLDLLLIDDIQFISGNKSATQEQFFYTFNSMIEHKKQIVITCDTNPREIDGIEERLKSRFAWGLTVSIEPPELEMRAAILIRKAQMERVGLSDEVALFIARQIRSNVRELEGALKRLLAFANFHKQPVSLNLAKEALKDLLPGRAISLDHIQKEVADYYRIKVVDMYSARRNRAIARPRQLAMKLARELTELSLPDIGESFGGRDHTTVMHACKTIETLCGEDPAIKRDYETLLALLSA